jgi:glycogen debranching enzyme
VSRSAPEPAVEVLAGPGTITAIRGLTFAISDELGDIDDGAAGLFAHDARHLSRLELTIDGARLQRLGAGLVRPDLAHFRTYALLPRRHPDPPLECERRRHVLATGMVERISLTSWFPEAVEVEVGLALGADFADIFEVRRLAEEPSAPPTAVVSHRRGTIVLPSGGARCTRVRLSPPPDRLGTDDLARWRVILHRGRPWELEVRFRIEGSPLDEPRPPALRPSSNDPSPGVSTEPEALAAACGRSQADLRALSLTDWLDPSRTVMAAGIPWFVALFGRDSLIAAHQARAFLPRLMLDTLQALAARQGRVDDPGNGEQPGKILHEVRLTDRPWLGEGTTRGARPYYGSIDATPLFLILLGEAWRWGASREALAALLPAARAAAEWMRGPGDPDGDGFLEYHARTTRALSNQGWKDSENAVQFADGTRAEGPIALVEVQGYASRARRELAGVLSWLGDDAGAARLDDEADALRARIRESFWVPGSGGAPGLFALALDGEKRRVDAEASNMGHLLWCDVADHVQAAQVAERLTSPAMATGWGLRTLSSSMAGFNPISYHCGSVWPHDTAIACEGLRRYGLDAAAMRLAGGLIDALGPFEGRLPELFGGHARAPGDFPVPYPTACRPQAWAAGVPLSFVPLLLGLQPHAPTGLVCLAPVLPDSVRSIEVHGIAVAGGALSVSVDEDGTHLLDVPAGLRVEITAAPRPAV